MSQNTFQTWLQMNFEHFFSNVTLGIEFFWNVSRKLILIWSSKCSIILVLNRYRYRYRPISALFADIGIGRYNIGIFGRYRYLNIVWKTCHFWGLTTKNSWFLLINLVSMQFMKILRENMSFLRFNYWKFPNFANKPRIHAIHENIGIGKNISALLPIYRYR